MSVERLQKYRTDDASLHRSDWLGQISLGSHFAESSWKHYLFIYFLWPVCKVANYLS